MRVEHIRQCIRGATQEEAPDDTNLINVISLVQEAFQFGYLVGTCSFQMVLLATKWCVKDFGLIVLVDFLWKSTTVIINRPLTSSICYHNTFHGFHTGRGTGTTTLECKLLQYLMAIR